MDYILSIAAYVAIAAIVAVSMAPLVVILQLITIFKIRRLQMSQADFDAKIDAANEALDAIAEAIEAEADQIADFIAALPEAVDTSALDGVVARLNGVAASVSAVFEPEVEPEPVVEPV